METMTATWQRAPDPEDHSEPQSTGNPTAQLFKAPRQGKGGSEFLTMTQEITIFALEPIHT